MMSHCDCAPLREGPNSSALREEGEGCGKVVDRDLERTEMARCAPNGALRHGKFGARGGAMVAGGFDQHGDVEMVLEQIAGFDCALVAAVDQDDAIALQLDRRRRWRRFGGRREQRCHLRSGSGGVARPAGRLADVGELYGMCAAGFRRRFGKQRRFLGAGDRERAVLGGNGPEAVEFGAAELGCHHGVVPAAAADGIGIERHRSFAGTDEKTPRDIRHYGHEPV